MDLGELKNIWSVGRSSENGVESPSLSQVSVKNIVQLRKKVLFASELALMSAKHRDFGTWLVLQVQLRVQRFV